MRPPIPKEIYDRLLVECFENPKAYKELGWLCDNVGARLSGADSGRKAEEWAFRLFTEWGLENVRFEDVEVSVWERGPLSVRAIGPVEWSLTALAHGNCPINVDFKAPVLDLAFGEREDYEKLGSAVHGKVALCVEGVRPGHRGLHRSEKLLIAHEAGAAALMILSSASGMLPRTGVCKYAALSPIPSLGISQEDGERLLRIIHSGTHMDVSIKMTNSFKMGVGRNVLADLKGTDKPDEIVIAGGHLDCWDVATGATDNGLGSAIVLEMARAMAAVKRPSRTIRFALWAAEEIGLCGSKSYASSHESTMKDHVAVLNFDMTGDPFGYWTPGFPTPKPLLKQLVELMTPIGMKQEFDHKAGLHSDHQPFMLRGVPVVSLLAKLHTQGAHYYHAVGDTFDKVDLPSQCRASLVGATTMYALADAPERTYAMLDRDGIKEMIKVSNLEEALKAEGWSLPKAPEKS